jgi:hypothetical protein
MEVLPATEVTALLSVLHLPVGGAVGQMKTSTLQVPVGPVAVLPLCVMGIALAELEQPVREIQVGLT